MNKSKISVLEKRPLKVLFMKLCVILFYDYSSNNIEYE